MYTAPTTIPHYKGETIERSCDGHFPNTMNTKPDTVQCETGLKQEKKKLI